jgi:crotonobetainyl-CoA:carnitine CoA-transferase CaiB-like acyl-CoA transferase
MNDERALDDIVVTELGDRDAVGICGSLLSQLGAIVIRVEPSRVARPHDARRVQLVAGKLSLSYDESSANDRALLSRLVARSDAVLTSSDVDPAGFQIAAQMSQNVICDVTAFGNTGPRAGEPMSEMQIQALSGIMHTTGHSDRPPLPISVPVTGYMTAAYAVAAILAALRVRRLQGFCQRIDIAMFDAAVVSLNGYLTGVLTGQVADRSRMGNRHTSIAPWNQYRTADGWILICAGSQSQWDRLCERMGRPDVALQFKTQPERVRRADEVDAIIEAWTRTMSMAECVDRLGSAGVACGPIAPVEGFAREANLDFRGMIRRLHDPVSCQEIFVPASPMGLKVTPPLQAERIPAPGADRAEVERLVSRGPVRKPEARRPGKPARPLDGIRVVEVGQYTTAPLCARHLAHLGADVIKIEKIGGDESRTYGPFLDGRSEINWMNNADKRGMMLDLLSPAGKDVLKSLLRTADVFIENNKPGTLARFGFSREVLAGINPKLIYCAISGFGTHSLYANRPGFDTVIQAMSGFMSAVNPGGEPVKSGISMSDQMGAEMGIVSIIAAIENRDRNGRGEFIDLSMQDVSCWLTAPLWNTEPASIPRPSVLRCADGYVLAETGEARLPQFDALAEKSRSEAGALLAAAGLTAVPVNTVREAAEMPHTIARKIWFTMRDGGQDWPTLCSPLRLQLTPPEITRAAPRLDQDRKEILREIGYTIEVLANEQL